MVKRKLMWWVWRGFLKKDSRLASAWRKWQVGKLADLCDGEMSNARVISGTMGRDHSICETNLQFRTLVHSSRFAAADDVM